MSGAGMGGAGMGGACPCIVHRYSFSRTDTTVLDSAGTAHGTLFGGVQSGGVVTLAGGASDQYVALPVGVLSGLANATFEAWVTWTGGTSNWQRVFDFGSNDGMGPNGQGTTNVDGTWIFFTPRAQATSTANCTMPIAGMPRANFTLMGPVAESCVFASSAFPSGMTHLAVVISGTTMTLYLAGAPVGTPATLPGPLSSVSAENNWLGRSQFTSDTEFAGTISEFRIYSTARSASQIAASSAAGPDTAPTQ